MNEQPFRPNTNAGDCDRLRDLLPAYSMGLTDPGETALVERLLPDCPELQAELAGYTVLAAAMPATVPQVAPPESLHTALMAQVASDTAAVTHLPPRTRRVLLWFAGAAALLAVVLLGVVAVQQAEINLLRDENAQLIARLGTRDNLLALAGEGDLTRYTLPATGETAAAQATVVSRSDAREGLIRVRNFPPTAPGRVYQAWLIQGETRISAGTFTVGGDGAALLVFSSPLRLAEIDYIGITPEPAGGSPGPTSDPVVFGVISGEA